MNLSHQLQTLKKLGRYRKLSLFDALSCEQSADQDEKMINLSSNDYLGLACDKQLKKDFLMTYQQDDDFLFGSSASRLLTGNFAAHEHLESLLGECYGRSALIFNSGYHMNVGILPALSDDKTLILADKWVHASLIDGIRLSAAKYYRYRHQDLAQLHELIAKHHHNFDQIIIVTESVFSMDGDVTDLLALVALKNEFKNLMLYVDEAHAVGVFGHRGLGVAEALDVIDDIDILVGAFGKAWASIGGFVVCEYIIKEYLINTMRPLIFSTNLPPVNVLWSAHTFKKSLMLDDKRQTLQTAFNYLIDQLKALGLACPSNSQIVPIIVGDDQKALLLAKQLQDSGFFVLPIRPPTVPVGMARVRVCLHANITQEQIERFVSVVDRLLGH